MPSKDKHFEDYSVANLVLSGREACTFELRERVPLGLENGSKINSHSIIVCTTKYGFRPGDEKYETLAKYCSFLKGNAK